MDDARIPETHSDKYAQTFAKESMSIDAATELDREVLDALGVKIIGHLLSILRHARKVDAKPTKPPTVNTAAPKPPQLAADLTRPQFRKFRIDWDVYKKMSGIQKDYIAAQIYSLCDVNVQNSIINTSTNFFSLEEKAILDTLERIVTRRANPTVHRMTFYNIVQAENESVNDYLVRLNATAIDCEYTCPQCKHDLSPSHVRDQFIKGISNSDLQADILAKAESLTTIEAVVKHAQAHESALQDQVALQEPSTHEVAAFQGRFQRQRPTGAHRPNRGRGGGNRPPSRADNVQRIWQHGARQRWNTPNTVSSMGPNM